MDCIWSLSANGTLVFSKEVFVCSLHEWLMQSNPIMRWHICQGSINGLSFSPDGKYLATVGRDGMSVPLSFLFHTCRSSPWVSDAHFIWQSHTSFLECPSTENWHTCPIGYRPDNVEGVYTIVLGGNYIQKEKLLLLTKLLHYWSGRWVWLHNLYD